MVTPLERPQQVRTTSATLWVRRGRRALLVAGAIAYLSMFLDSFPRVYVDEPWESIPAYQLYHTGVINNPVLTGRTYNEEHLLAPRLVQTIVMGLAYRIFGPQLVVGRLVSLVYAFASMVAFYCLLRRCGFSELHTVLALALLGTNNFFYIFARLIRPEIILVFHGILAFLFVYKGVTENSRRAFAWAGVVAAIGTCTHPVFLLFVAALTLIIVSEYRLATLTRSPFWIFCAAFFAGMLPYLVYLFHQDAANHFTHFWAQVSDQATQGNRGFWATTLGDELDRYRQYVFYPYRVPVAAAELFFICASFRLRDRLARFSRTIIFTHVLLFPILIAARNARYFLPVIPFIIVLIVRGIQQWSPASLRAGPARPLTNPGWRTTVTLVSGLLLAYQLISNPVAIRAKRVVGYEQLLQELRGHIPPHSRVWGSMVFWFGFIDCEYRTQYTFGKDLYDFRPEYVITDDNVIWRKTAYVSVERGKRWDDLTDKIQEYASSYGQVVAELPDSGYGGLRVWRIDTTRVPVGARSAARDGRPPQ
jgi:hypothetical protein